MVASSPLHTFNTLGQFFSLMIVKNVQNLHTLGSWICFFGGKLRLILYSWPVALILDKFYAKINRVEGLQSWTQIYLTYKSAQSLMGYRYLVSKHKNVNFYCYTMYIVFSSTC